MCSKSLFLNFTLKTANNKYSNLTESFSVIETVFAINFHNLIPFCIYKYHASPSNYV